MSTEMQTDSMMCGMESAVNLQYLPCVNYSLVLNGIEVLNSLVLTNDTGSAWTDVVLTVSGRYMVPSRAAVAQVGPGQSVHVSGLRIAPQPDALLSLTEAVDTTFTLTVERAGGEPWSHDYAISLLAHDQWTGIRVMPHLLASFVVPNSPLLAMVSARAAALLQSWTGSGALDGYQAQNRQRVRLQVAAFYEALRAEGIIYCEPPAHFEAHGQRIRLADKVLTEKLGTCIDTSLLMASCLESVGLHPILVLLRGHAMVGTWLQPGIHSDMVCDDPSLLLKESADGNNNLVVLESTALTESGEVPFDTAVDRGMHALRDDRRFECFIDVHRCRLGNVRPMPQQGQMQAVQGLEHAPSTSPVAELTHYDELQLVPTDGLSLTKQQLWERKLLDFSLRNNLLNMRLGRRVVPFISFDIDTLEDHMQEGEDYSIAPCPGKKIEPGEHGIYDSQHLALEHRQLVTELIGSNKLLSYLTEAELTGALKFLYRSSRTALEENGANSLFLALGVLKWYETERSEMPRFAPILLLPVDIIRRAGNKYVVRKRDEDIIFNITLVELLKQNFNINLDPLLNLPADRSGVDVKLIFTHVRRAIMNQRRWDVVEESMLGLFSFNKFVMWNDLHTNASRLRENTVVASLIDGVNHLPPAREPVDARTIDRTVPPCDFAIPLDVDSSQMEAVVKSGRGQSFILHGPPGTGKSQTITNMIANALYHGRRVLFVAEKMAALEVVQHRLASIGLDAFCLELHSNKVTKSHFLGQMEKALNVTHAQAPQDYARQSQELFAKRQELIAYMEALHRRGDSGLSLYDCITRYLAIDSPEATAEVPPVEAIDAAFVEHLEQQEAPLQAVVSLTGAPGAHPLRGLEPVSNDAASMSALQQRLGQFVAACADHAAHRAALNAVAPLPVTSDAQMPWAEQLEPVLAQLPVLNLQLIAPGTTEASQAALHAYHYAGVECERAWQELTGRFDARIATQCDGTSLRNRWRAIEQQWFLPRFFARRKFVKELRTYGPVESHHEVDGLLTMLENYQSRRAALDRQSVSMAQLAGPLATLRQERWDDIGQLLQNLPALNRLLADYAGAAGERLPAVVDRLCQAAQGQWPSLRDRWLAALRTMLASWRQMRALAQEISSLAQLPQGEPLQQLQQSALRWRDAMPAVRDWYHWVDAKRRLDSDGLRAVALQIENEARTPAGAVQAVLKAIYHRMIDHIIDCDPQLRMFNGMLFHQKIEAYRRQTALFQELSKHELYCSLAARVPSQATASAASSEVSVLKRYITNGGRGTSIRTIIDSIPTLLPRLCPCMLMSPISVAQYIDLSAEKFDLVIFDEASQMPTSEAVGAIARGKALVVVGDSKQMPPTSFFSASQVDEDEADIDDMESILDDCKILSMDECHLTWHYRSKHESLIAFSNALYYDNRLLTFPSVDDREMKVRLVPIEGTYDKGRTRSNPAEAKAIVEEVVRRLSDPQLRQRSLGVVSFSKVQQNLIEDVLTDELDRRPDLKAAAYDVKEPIFIKNLENVQGDERDVILFSVGYGPDVHGRVSLNFGPLNNVGGERRLNVAVSRARYEMVVYSTLKPEQIDLNRSHALGVEGLKAFLEYAQTGRLAVPATVETEVAQNVIVDQVAQALRQRGYLTSTHVGRSSFKIDLAVAAPSDPDRYLLGILCDGKNYFATRTTRDREIVQPSILGMLHWHIMRIYSIDWYVNADREIERVVEALEKIEHNPDAHVGGQSSAEPAYTFNPDALPAVPRVLKRQRNAGCRPYDELTSLSFVPPARADYNPQASYNKLAVREVLMHEQPVTLGYLCKHVARLLGFGHVGNVIMGAVTNGANAFYRDPMEFDSEPTYWLDEASARDFKGYRAPSPRAITEVPAVEIAQVVQEVVDEEFSLQREQMAGLVARKLGFGNTGSKINAVVAAVIDHMIATGKLRQNGTAVTAGDDKPLDLH